MLFISLLTFSKLSWSFSHIEVDTSNGASFQKLGSLTISSSYHILAFEINLDKIFRSVRSIDKRLGHYIKNPLFQELSSNAQQSAKETRASVQRSLAAISAISQDLHWRHPFSSPSYQDSSHKISRRGLLNAVGEAGEWLFGLATQSEIDALTQGIDRVSTSNAALVTQVNVHTTLLHKLAPEIEELQKAGISSRSAIEALSKTQFVNGFALELGFEIQRAIRTVSRLNSMDIGIKAMERGVLAFELISKSDFSDALDSLSARGINLLFSKTERSLIYPRLLEILTLSKPNSRNIRYALILPTERIVAPFDLYQINTSPTFNATLGVAFEFKLNNKFLGVSNDLQSATLLDSMSNCKNFGSMYWCPQNIQIYSSLQHICELELYYHRKPHDYCDLVISKLDEPIFTAVRNGFRFAAPKGTKVIIRCKNGQRPEKHYISGNGVIALRQGCQLHHQGVVMFAPANFNMSQISKQKYVEILPIVFVENYNFSKLLHKLSKVNLTKLKKLNLGPGINVHTIENNLKILENTEENSFSLHNNLHLFGVTLGIILFLGLSFCILKIIHKFCCCFGCFSCFKTHHPLASRMTDDEILDFEQRILKMEELLGRKTRRRVQNHESNAVNDSDSVVESGL